MRLCKRVKREKNSFPKNVLLGLGNPGRSYQRTRHNIGFQVVDALAQQLHAAEPWKMMCRGAYQIFHHHTDDVAFFLVKPLTFLNNSGTIIPILKRKHGIAPQDITVIHDTLDMRVGTLKLKRSGGSGGHNGLKSIIAVMGSDFPRIAIGIGKPQYREQTHSYVLSNPSLPQQAALSTAIDRIVASYSTYPHVSIEKRMETLNQNIS